MCKTVLVFSIVFGQAESLVVQGRRHAGQNKPIAAFHLGSPRWEKFGQVQALWLASAHSMSYWARERLCLLEVSF